MREREKERTRDDKDGKRETRENGEAESRSEK